MIVPIFLLAVLGLLLSITAHIATYVGLDPLAMFPYIWALHVGVFVVWLPAVIISKRRTTESAKPFQWRTALAGTPAWLRWLAGPLVAYVVFNFAYTMIFHLASGSPAMRDGQFVLQEHGKLLRVISAAEYHAQQAYQVRLFSGHWIVFYFLGMMILYPRSGSQTRDQVEKMR